jgi:predicted Rdx family selenoprotein
VLNANGIDASAREGEHSQFDVVADGELVFSKQREGRFPEEDELLGLLSTSR